MLSWLSPVAHEALVGVGRQIANQARSRGVFESDRLNEHLNDLLAGGFPLLMSAPQYRRLTGKPLGITREVAEYEGPRLLGVALGVAPQPGYEAL